ncbi:MAG: nucleotide sugar dehydrogenase [Thermoplasmata archaeon HGW-Thermoplasmata-2]|nr:MAG: nucleotide sugar dehydrogenase [Thermoplasmata archaeon HGW-Thermoplasmata-2]
MKIYGAGTEEAASALKQSKIRIAVYGLGKMGLPLAAVFADAGAIVAGIDISKSVVDIINKGANTVKEEPGLDELVKRGVAAGRLKAYPSSQKADLHIILVPTLLRGTKPRKRSSRGAARPHDAPAVDMTPVLDCAKSIAKVLEKGDIVITECTMPPGSTEKLIPILEKSGLKANKDFGIGHCPERTMTGTAIRDITGEYPKVVGAGDRAALDALRGIYSAINKSGVVQCSSIRAAECVKVFEGIYRDVNIALANEMAVWCDREGLDALEIFKIANTQKYCHIHKPGCGVGGHCIPYYPHFIMDRQTALIRLARKTNEDMAKYAVKLAAEALKSAGVKPKDASVLVLGLTFRAGVKEFAHTMAKPIIEETKKVAGRIYASDPLCGAEDAKHFGAEWMDISEQWSVVSDQKTSAGKKRKQGFKDIDAIIITTDDKSFRKLAWAKIAKGMHTPIVVDGRNILNPEEMRKLGFKYFGIGRR